MNNLLLAVSASMIATTALAADLAPALAEPVAPAVAPFSWTGFYAGVNAGYGWGDARDKALPSPPEEFGVTPFRVSIDPRGALGGLQAGYNWQTGNFVLGGEADIQISDIERTGRTNELAGNPAWFSATNEKIDAFGTARLRAGYSFDRLLVYATGGLAYGHIKYSSVTHFDPLPVFTYSGDAKKWKAGWTIGGGLEYAVTDHWTIRGEYLYYDLGKSSYRAQPLAANPPFNIKHTVDAKGSIGRLAVNFKF